MDDAVSHTVVPATRRRWFQYSLRSLLAPTTLAAIGLSLLYAHVERYRRQLDAVEKLKPYAVFETRPGAWAWLRRWRGESNPVDIDAFTLKMRSGRPDHSALSTLPQLFLLKGLTVNEVPLTGKTLNGVARLTDLEMLNLRDTQITDDDAICLLALKKLKWLDLDGTRITDRTIERLEALPNLEGVWIRCSGVTDASLPALLRLKNLKNVGCYGSGMSDAAIQELADGLHIEIWGACGCGCCNYYPLSGPCPRAMVGPPLR